MSSKSPPIFKLAEEKASLGLLFQQQGKLDAAISLYREALAIAPKLQFVHYNLGIIFHYQGNLLAASTHYSQAIALNPEHIQAHYNMGVVLQQQGLLDSAISSYQEVINLSQTSRANILIQVQAYSNFGSILVKENRFEEAREIFQQAIALKPEDATLYNNLGQAFLEAGKIVQAIGSYSQAIALQPELIIAHHNLGKACQKQSLHSEAIAHFQEVIKQQPENIYAYSDCGFSYMEQGKLAEAIGVLKKVISNNPFVENYCKAADLLTESDELNKAKIACAQFIKILQQPEINNQLFLEEVRKRIIETYLSLGNVSFEYGDYSQAENYYKKALQIQPLNQELYLRLGNSLAKQKRFNTAIIIYQMGLAVAGNNHSISYSISLALEKVLEKRHKPSEKINADGVKNIFNIVDKKSSLTIDKTPKTECKGLNCEPCLKRIFKQLQPIHLGYGIHSFAREEIAARHPNKASKNISPIEIQETPTFVTKVSNGRAWIVPQKNNWMICNAIAIINENNQLLAEVSREYPGQLPGCQEYDINTHRFFTTEKLPPLEQIDGTVAVLSGLSGNVYFHWMVDILPRIEILRRNGIKFDEIDGFLINSTQQPFQQETLRILGIPEDKIIESDRHPYIQAQKLIVPSFPCHLGWLPKWALEFHRKVFLKDGLASGKNQDHQENYPYPELIYISRNKAKHRRVINEEKVVDLLGQYGFVPIELETLSVAEQITLFAHAKAIASPHGSALTNIMFCTPGTTVIELVSPNYIKHYYWVISQQLGLKHYYLTGEEFSSYPIRQLMYPNPLTEDILINLSSLEKMLKQASIIKTDFKPKLNYPTGKQTSQEIILFGKMFGKMFDKKKINSEIEASIFSQKQEENHIDRTVEINQMPSKVNPLEAATYFHERALFYLEQKQLDEAKTACEQALKNQPNFALACKTMGRIMQAKEQIEAAFEWYLRAINIQPDFAEAYVNIGTLYARKQQWQEAINYYEKAIAIKLDLVPAYRNLAKAYQKIGKLTEAANFQYQAYCLEPSKITEPEYINLGNTLLQQRKLTEAISCYRSALKLNPTSAVAYQNLAEALSQKGDFAEANTCYRQAIQLGITNLSNVNHNQLQKPPNILNISDKRLASASIKSQIEAKHNQHNIDQIARSNLIEKKNSQETHQQLINSNQNNQNNQNIYLQQDAVEAYNRLAKILQNQGKAAEAWQWYKKAIEIAPNDAEIYQNLGSLYGQQQQWQEAIKCYYKALEIESDRADVYRNLAAALTHIGKQVEASECWEKAYSLEPETATAEEQMILGNTLLQMNLVERAISSYCNAIKINPNLTGAYQKLGEALKLQSNSQYSLSQEPTYLNNNYLNPTPDSLQSVNTEKLSVLQSNNSPKNQPDNYENIAQETSGFKQISQHFYQAINQLISQLKSALNQNKKMSEKFPENPGENHNLSLKLNLSYPAKPDFQIQEIVESYIEKPLVSGEANLINTHWNWQKKELLKDATEELEATAETSPKQVENSDKISGQANSKSTEAAKPAIALPDIYIQSALAYSKQGLFEQAIAQCQQAIAVKPDMALAYKILGDVQQKMGSASQRTQAKENYLKAISIDSRDAFVYANLGSLYAEEELWPKAIPYYQKAIALKPDFAGAYRNLAKAWLQVGKPAEAADCWYQAYFLEPENITPDQYLNLGNTLCRQGQLTQAISCYQWAIKLNPNNAAAYHNLGSALKRQGKFDEAAVYEQKAQKLSSGVLESADAAEKQTEVNSNQPPQATINPEDILTSPSKPKQIKKLSQVSQVNQADLIKQASANFVQGKFYEAIATCEQAISIKPDAVAYQIIGKASGEINRVNEAIAAYQKALEIKPDFAEVYVSLGELYIRQQQQEEAIACYQKAIALAPDLKDGYRGLVQVWLEQGKVEQAEELSYNALIQHPTWATPQEFCTLGRGLVAEGKTEPGITCFRQAIELDPHLWEAHYSLGQLSSTQQHWDEAVKYYRQAVELNSEFVGSYYGLGKALAEKAEWQEAISCYQKVIELGAKVSQENSSEREENIDSGIDLGEVYHKLGDALQEIGQLDESVEAYHRAIELTANLPE